MKLVILDGRKMTFWTTYFFCPYWQLIVLYFASAEPLKKKKKVDIQLVVVREQRKMKRIERAIRKQEAKGRQLKPIDEIEGNRSFLKTLESVTALSDFYVSTHQ